MALREADDDYLEQVGRWWDELLPRMAPYLHQRGGPIILVQVHCPGITEGLPLPPTCPTLTSAAAHHPRAVACAWHTPAAHLPHPHQRGGPRHPCALGLS